MDNLLLAWQEFLHGKRKKSDVQVFGRNLIDNLYGLHEDLASRQYVHGGYEDFTIADPKPRHIHKASVRDRVLHHALYRTLYPFFDRTFTYDSYSCREYKGTHKALNRFRQFSRQVSRNHTRTAWVLKCDIKKFFASVDQTILLGVLNTYIGDTKVLWLIQEIIDSFYSTQPGKGLPLGNLTSQLLVNIYMNEFDQYVKHQLKARWYIRYADDFVFFAEDRARLELLLPKINGFLLDVLALSLHPDKVYIQTLASGIDFLGWVHFPDHRVLRTTTKRRMFRRVANAPKPATIYSYRGLLSHGNTYKLQAMLPDSR